MRIVVDPERCVSSGQCVLTDPEVFSQSDDDGTVVLRTERPANPDSAAEAVLHCPGRALSVVAD